jgi:hypothetical protein
VTLPPGATLWLEAESAVAVASRATVSVSDALAPPRRAESVASGVNVATSDWVEAEKAAEHVAVPVAPLAATGTLLQPASPTPPLVNVTDPAGGTRVEPESTVAVSVTGSLATTPLAGEVVSDIVGVISAACAGPARSAQPIGPASMITAMTLAIRRTTNATFGPWIQLVCDIKVLPP